MFQEASRGSHCAFSRESLDLFSGRLFFQLFSCSFEFQELYCHNIRKQDDRRSNEQHHRHHHLQLAFRLRQFTGHHQNDGIPGTCLRDSVLKELLCICHTMTGYKITSFFLNLQLRCNGGYPVLKFRVIWVTGWPTSARAFG
jgi:hypothetical protein